MFTPSLDWGNEVVASLIWVVKAWSISAVVMLIVLVIRPSGLFGTKELSRV